MDLEIILRTLKSKNLLTSLGKKRLITSFLPITLYIKLVRASVATRKPMAYILSTALETYCMRNEDKHNEEMQALGILQGKIPEEIITEELEARANKED